jgi:hypothetical protein
LLKKNLGIPGDILKSLCSMTHMQLNTRVNLARCSVQVDKTKKSDRRTRTPGTDDVGLIQQLLPIGHYCRVKSTPQNEQHTSPGHGVRELGEHVRPQGT